MTTIENYTTPEARLADPAGSYEAPSIFSMRGRLNRARYFWTSFAIWMAMYTAAFGFGLVAGLTQMNEMVVTVGSLAVSILAGVMVAFQAVKRLHDLDRPGTHYWLLMVPFYNIYLSFVLLFKLGSAGTNRFGADPLEA